MNERKLLGEVALFCNKQRVPLSSMERAVRRGSYPYYGAAGVIDYVDDFLFDGTFVLIGEDGTVQVDGGHPMVTVARGRFWVNNHAHVVRASSGRDIDTEFLRYALIDSDVIPFLSGSVQPKLSMANAKQLPVWWPDESTRSRIVGALGALDDLIEVNRGLVSDLDASVRLLGLEAMLRAQGRPLIPLTEIAEVAKGYSYKSSELIAGDGWLVNLKNIGRSGTFEARGFKPLTATVKPHQIIDNGDVLVAQTDLTQDREVIARPVRVRKGTLEGRLVASLDLAIVRPKAPHTNESIFAILNTEDFRSHALGYCNGTTVLHMGARALPDYAAPSLTQSEIKALTARVRPLREAADDLNIEISNLEATRDELLPLLMSGRVRVAEEVAA